MELKKILEGSQRWLSFLYPKFGLVKVTSPRSTEIETNKSPPNQHSTKRRASFSSFFLPFPPEWSMLIVERGKRSMDNFLGNKLREYRQKNGLTQKQLASILFVTDKAVSKWERGAGQPDIETLKRIAFLLDISLDDLLNGRDPITYFEYKSRAAIGELPLIHIVFPNLYEIFKYDQMYHKKGGSLQRLRKVPQAKGVISCGMIASGGISIGVISRGIVALGFLSIGLFAGGLASFGLFAGGCLALGGVAAGNLGLGLIALGNVAAGYFSLGNFAFGNIAIGNYGYGKYAYSLGNEIRSDDVRRTLQSLQEQSIPDFSRNFVVDPLLQVLQSDTIGIVFAVVLTLFILLIFSALIVGLIQIRKTYMRP